MKKMLIILAVAGTAAVVIAAARGKLSPLVDMARNKIADGVLWAMDAGAEPDEDEDEDPEALNYP